MMAGQTRIAFNEAGDDMTRSCNNCAFFVNNSNTPLEHSGYCLFFMLGNIDKKDSQKKIRIANGKEIEIADNCEGYFDVANI
jgi:hypothetical protein